MHLKRSTHILVEIKTIVVAALETLKVNMWSANSLSGNFNIHVM